MRFRPLVFVCLALLLLGLAGTLYKVHFPPGPVGDEAAYVLIAGSLWHDHDLNYDQRDLDRAYDTWDQGPYGLILFTRDGGETTYFGKPFVYSALAVPFYALLGAQGLMVFNMLLYVAMFGTAWWLLARRAPELAPQPGAAVADPAPAGPFCLDGLGGLFLGGFFFASASFVYVFWMQPEVFNMACTFFPLAVWAVLRGKATWTWKHHAGLAFAALCLAAAFVSKEPLAVMALPLGVDLLWSRRYKGLATLMLAGLLGALALVGVQYKLSGAWSPYRDVQRRSFESNYPLEMQGDPWDLYKGTDYGSWNGMGVETQLRPLLYNLGYFLVGRHTGLVPYFPFAVLALVLFALGPRDRFAWLVLAGVGLYVLFFFLVRPGNYHGGAGFIGNRYFAGVYPATLFLVTRLRARGLLVLPFAAAGLWTASVLAVPVQQIAPEFTLQSHVRSAAFQRLPLELTLLGHGKLPGYWTRNWGQGTWVLRKDDFFAQENHPDGIWVRGASESEVIVVSPVPLATLYFIARSPLPSNVLTVDSGADRVVVRFDTAEKRSGVPVELALQPVAEDLGFLSAVPHEYFYRFTLATTHGWMPMRTDPESQDPRYLSTFLSFTGGGP